MLMTSALLIEPDQAHREVTSAWKKVKQHLLTGGRQLALLVFDPQNRGQQEHYHGQIGDIAEQCEFMDRTWSADDWKRILVDAFYRVTKDDPGLQDEWYIVGKIELIPSLDGTGWLMLGKPTRAFPRPLASAFIDFIAAWGDSHGVKWSEPRRGA